MKRKNTKSGFKNEKAQAKSLTTLQKARAAQKAIKAKLAALKAEFKTKLKDAVETAYEKAHAAALKTHEQKAQARQKLLNAVEAKFEKKYAKKTAKANKPKRRKKSTSMSNAHHTMTKMVKRAGRPKISGRGRPRKIK